ncbi:Rho termination factor N-terminal domain-containing protein [Alienimonas californiensis]|nr:Rho termination factor N-terminal domain-containing protein [Alienimonas californiensis]
MGAPPPAPAPMTDPPNPTELSTRELYDLARRHGIRGRSLMTREELLAALAADEPHGWG